MAITIGGGISIPGQVTIGGGNATPPATPVTTWTTSSGNLGSITSGSSASFTVVATTTSGSVVYSVDTGSLPTGMTLGSANGVISGTTSNAAGVDTFTLSAVSNAGGNAVQRSFSINVDAAPVTPTTTWTTSSGNLGSITSGSSASFTVVASATSGNVVYSVASGSLPTGMTLGSANGVISGTTSNVAGVDTFTLSAISDAGGNAVQRSFSINVDAAPARTYLKVSYVDITATGSFALIAANAWTNSNFIIAGFVDFTTNTPSAGTISAFQTIANNVTSGTEVLFSLGGATYDGTTINTTTANAIIANTVAQITSLNATLTKPITGVDLDLENGITEATITAITNGFKAEGYTVCIAPQIIATAGADIDIATPTNLGLSSGGATNQYGAAVASGNVDYIFVQNYNSGGFTIGNVAESSLSFLTTSTQALANCVNSGYQVDIPETTQVICGTVVNTGAAFNINNMFGITPGVSYTQSTTLTNLNSAITALKTQNLGNAFAGVGAWSLNNDYYPSAYGDNWAVVGAYTDTIYGPTAPLST